MPRHDVYQAFYMTLRSRIVHLLPRLRRQGPGRAMDAHRACAQLDAILCHLVESLDRHGARAEAIAACIASADLHAIGSAIQGVRDDTADLAFRLHHVSPIGGRRCSLPCAIRASGTGAASPLPHVAFQTRDLQAALDDAMVIVAPFDLFDGCKVAVIDDGGLPTELLEMERGMEASHPHLSDFRQRLTAGAKTG